MDRGELANILFRAAENAATAHGMRLGHGADGDIRRFAGTSAELLTAKHPIAGPDDPEIAAAATAFERLVDGMVVAASEIPGYRQDHPGIIGEDSLARALSRLCPLFPIC